MRILQVVHGFPPQNTAGTEIYTYALSRELAKGNAVHVFCRISDAKKKEYEIRRETLEGLPVNTVNNTFRLCDSFEKLYKNDEITERFAAALDTVQPDIVHIQHLIFLSTSMIDEIKLRGIPVVYTLHDYWIICPQWHFLTQDLTPCEGVTVSRCMHCLEYQLSIRSAPKTVYLAVRAVMPDFIIEFLKNAYLNWTRARDPRRKSEQIQARMRHFRELWTKVDRFIAPSRFLGERFRSYGVPAEKISFARYGIDVHPFAGRPRVPSDRLRFGFIGTVLPAKGVDILIEAFNGIADSRAELRIYGKLYPYKGFEYYPRMLRKLAKNRNIRFMGGFDHDDIGRVFSELDVLVFPSIWNENCPLTILESFSAGVPVIASRIGGIPELIRDGHNGLLFGAGNAADLREKIAGLIREPQLLEKLRAGVAAPKSIGENAREMEAIYAGLLKGKI